MTEDLGILIRLSAQRALLDNVSASLRAVSVDVDESKVYYRCIFDSEPTEDERELLSVASTEIIADFPELYTLDEEFLHIPYPEKMEHLTFLVFLRHEVM